MSNATSALCLLLAAAPAAAQPGLSDPAPPARPITHVLGERASQATDRAWAWGLRLTGLSGIGALPGVNVGGEVAGYLRWQERFVELGLGRWKPEETIVVSAADDTKLGLDVWTLRGGWASMEMPLRAWLLVEAGELAGPHAVMPAGVPRMVTGNVQADHRWFAAGGGFGVGWPMSERARLVGAVEVAVPIGKQEMMLDSGAPFEPDAAAARASLGIEVGWR
ncbi:MAG: hypothetical protein JNL83_09345 [Myxococcales bacterium]|nr:hypothetical protein [Myxococcales bacterium]